MIPDEEFREIKEKLRKYLAERGEDLEEILEAAGGHFADAWPCGIKEFSSDELETLVEFLADDDGLVEDDSFF